MWATAVAVVMVKGAMEGEQAGRDGQAGTGSRRASRTEGWQRAGSSKLQAGRHAGEGVAAATQADVKVASRLAHRRVGKQGREGRGRQASGQAASWQGNNERAGGRSGQERRRVGGQVDKPGVRRRAAR